MIDPLHNFDCLKTPLRRRQAEIRHEYQRAIKKTIAIKPIFSNQEKEMLLKH